MVESKWRKIHNVEVKAKVGLKAVRDMRTSNEKAQLYIVHSVMVGKWKQEILANAGALLESRRGLKLEAARDSKDHLYGEIGRVELDRL